VGTGDFDAGRIVLPHGRGNESNNFVFVSGGDGTRIVNVTNKTAPVLVSSVLTNAGSIGISWDNQLIFASDYYADSVAIVDINATC